MDSTIKLKCNFYCSQSTVVIWKDDSWMLLVWLKTRRSNRGWKQAGETSATTWAASWKCRAWKGRFSLCHSFIKFSAFFSTSSNRTTVIQLEHLEHLGLAKINLDCERKDRGFISINIIATLKRFSQGFDREKFMTFKLADCQPSRFWKSRKIRWDYFCFFICFFKLYYLADLKCSQPLGTCLDNLGCRRHLAWRRTLNVGTICFVVSLRSSPDDVEKYQSQQLMLRDVMVKTNAFL